MNSIKKSDNYPHSLPKTYACRKEMIQLFDFFIAITNFGLIFIVITLLSFSNLILYFIHLGVSLILFGSMFFTFFKKNPYYVYFCYGLLFCGSFYAIPFMVLSYSENFLEKLFFAIAIILLFPEICYIYNLTKGYNSVSRAIGGYKLYQNIGAGVHFDANRLNEYLNAKNLQIKMKEQEKQKDLKKKFKVNRIIFVSISCIIGFFTIAIISAII